MSPATRILIKRLLLAAIVGALASIAVYLLHLESNVAAYLRENSAVSAFNIFDWFGDSAGSLLIYGGAFLLAALPAYAAAGRPKVEAVLEWIVPGSPAFLRPPRRRVEPLLAELGMTRPLAFFGRTGELAALDRFEAHPDRFLWWSMHGPGGIGKTRLAAEWMLRAQMRSRMDVGFLDRDAANLESIRSFRPRRNTVIVVDEALLFAPQIWTYIAELAKRAPRFRHKVRILLIDWCPLVEIPGEVLSGMDNLSTQLLGTSRHYELLRQSVGRPGRKVTRNAAPPDTMLVHETPGIEFTEVPSFLDSLLVRPFDDRQSIQAMVADASGTPSPGELESIIEATEGNPLLIVAAALRPDVPPYRVIEGIARKMLHRAHSAGPETGPHIATTLCIAALSGPVLRTRCAELAGRPVKPAQLVSFFAKSRAEMWTVVPALEPELLAHEIVLQHMASLESAEQRALAAHCIDLDEAKGLRVIGNLWRRRTEAPLAVKLALGEEAPPGTSDMAVEYAYVLNALAAAAQQAPGYATALVANGRGLAALSGLKEGSEAVDPLALRSEEAFRRILFHTLEQIQSSRADYLAVFESLPVRPQDGPAIARGLMHAFTVDGAAARRATRSALSPDENDHIFEALDHGSPGSAAGAALELMEAGFRNQPFTQPAEFFDSAKRLVSSLCRRIQEGPDGLRIAAAWAASWLLDLFFSGHGRVALDETQQRQLLADLREITSPKAAGKVIVLLSQAVRREAPAGLLVSWCKRIDSSEPPEPPVPLEPAASPLREPFIAELRRRAAAAPDAALAARIGGAAIGLDALDGDLRGAVEAHLHSESALASSLLLACSRLGTSRHRQALPILRAAFANGSGPLRFGAFLALCARGEAGTLIGQASRPDDPVDYEAAIRGSGVSGFVTHLRRLTPAWVHKLKAKDRKNDRWAYYFVHVTPDNDPDFLAAIAGPDTVELESYGDVVGSSFGEEPTEELLLHLRARYHYEV